MLAITDNQDLGDVAITEHEGVYLVTTLTGSAYIIDFEKRTIIRNPNPDGEDDEKNLPKGGGVRRDRWRTLRRECAVGETSHVEPGAKASTREGPGLRLGSGHWLPDKIEDSGKDRLIS